MELSKLKAEILSRHKGSNAHLEEICKTIDDDVSVYPFNEFELLLRLMQDTGSLSFDDYLGLRQAYIESNPNLWIFEIAAPRGFGEKFAQTHVLCMCPTLSKPSKLLDMNYSGEYDFWLDGIKIEVKASRAVRNDSDEPLYCRAVTWDTESDFLMNFQQLKPDCCDVFVWLAVFRDVIVTWVLSSNEVLQNRNFSKGQHRGNHGNEGQLHVKANNIRELDQYRFVDGSLLNAIKEANKRNSI